MNHSLSATANDRPLAAEPGQPAGERPTDDQPDDQPAVDSYSRALGEIDSILAELDSGSIDIDTLSVRVGRGLELVQWCRQRLEAVKRDVDEVVADLGPNQAASAANPETEPGQGPQHHPDMAQRS